MPSSLAGPCPSSEDTGCLCLKQIAENLCPEASVSITEAYDCCLYPNGRFCHFFVWFSTCLTRVRFYYHGFFPPAPFPPLLLPLKLLQLKVVQLNVCLIESLFQQFISCVELQHEIIKSGENRGGGAWVMGEAALALMGG